jgi:hypothetical protein
VRCSTHPTVPARPALSAGDRRWRARTDTTKDAEPAWHRRERAKRAEARKLLHVEAAKELLRKHHGSAMPKGSKGAGKPYWVCGCGAWTWCAARDEHSGACHCHGCGRRRENDDGRRSPPATPTPRRYERYSQQTNDSSVSPSKSQLGDWIIQPSGSRAQSKARKAAERKEKKDKKSAAADRSYLRGDSRSRDPEPSPAPWRRPDGPEAAQHSQPRWRSPGREPASQGDAPWIPDDVDEATLEGWLLSLRSMPRDDALTGRIMRMEKRLEEIRKDPMGAGVTVQLLRAQALTKKRERQRTAADDRAQDILRDISTLRDEHDEALLAVVKADSLWAEAKDKERLLRAGVAGIDVLGAELGRASLAQEHLHALMGLQNQLEGLPAAWDNGNCAQAHAAALAQSTAIIKMLRATTAAAAAEPATHLPAEEQGAPSPAAAAPATPMPRQGHAPYGAPGSPEFRADATPVPRRSQRRRNSTGPTQGRGGSPRSRSRAASSESDSDMATGSRLRRPRHRGNRVSEREELRQAAMGTHDIRAAFGVAPPLPGGPAPAPAAPAGGASASQGSGFGPQQRHGDKERHELSKAAKGSGDIRKLLAARQRG